MDKIISLIDRMERMKLACDMEPNTDALSLSLWEFGEELAVLDEYGVISLARDLGISPDSVVDMAQNIRRKGGFRE